MGAHHLGELASRFAVLLDGDAQASVHACASLASGVAGNVVFYADRSHKRALQQSQATVVCIRPEHADDAPPQMARLLCEQPACLFAELLAYIHPPEPHCAGVASTAKIDAQAKVDASASIADFVLVEAGAVIGARVVIHSHVRIGAGVSIGDDSVIHSSAVIEGQSSLGRGVVIGSGARIGGCGFGYHFNKNSQQWVGMPHIGRVEVGDQVHVGANTCIDRGALDNTVIESGVKIDNQVQIGHNVHIGEQTMIAGCVGIAGSARIGRRCLIGGASGINGHITIADDVMVTGMAMVTQSIAQPGVYASGTGILEGSEWRKQVVRFRQLDHMYRQIRQWEKQ